MAAKHYDINIYGAVQGVGFRHYMRLKARAFGITGFICNQADGSVYMEAEGPHDALEKLKIRCWQGPPGREPHTLPSLFILAEEY